MSECDYLAWLTYESSRRFLFLEGTKTVDSEVFQAPICATQSVRNLHAAETNIGIRQHNSTNHHTSAA